ncbi:MAG: hypothetical protein BWY52_00577 [Chloroflexi bacterium ADurb.Bin325]|nr:MAG: hypothetical protein BWY52_00577 [Chloroflexi bacterium ADurb.Bin325]
MAAVVAQLGFGGPVACGLAGGLIVNGALLRAAFLDAAAALGLDLQPITLVTEPAQGAVRLAQRMIED